MTQEKMNQLRAALQKLPQLPVGTHLTDDEFVAFVQEEMTSEQETRIDTHLETCPECTAQLDAFFTAAETFPEEVWARQRSTFEARLRARLEVEGILPRRRGVADALSAVMTGALERLRAFLASLSAQAVWVAFAPAFDAGRAPWDYASPDEQFGVFVVEKANKDLVVRFDTRETALDGITVRLTAGSWHREVRLRTVASDQLGAEVIMTRDERAALPSNTVLSATLVGEAPRGMLPADR